MGTQAILPRITLSSKNFTGSNLTLVEDLRAVVDRSLRSLPGTVGHEAPLPRTRRSEILQALLVPSPLVL